MLDVQPPGVRASSEQRTLTQHKSVNNVKVYCLAKITGQLNTKSEMDRVAKESRTKQTAMEMVKNRYEEVKKCGGGPGRDAARPGPRSTTDH